jgi:tRNA pseudouridine38-40 synthase
MSICFLFCQFSPKFAPQISYNVCQVDTSLRRLKLTLEYDGSAFVGWQVQPNGESVQSCVEKALEQLCQQHINVEAAGRTDAGVHAVGQVVAFNAPLHLPLQAFSRGLSSLLPRSVAVRAASFADASFDPRRQAKGKHYRYQISNLPNRSPLRSGTMWEHYAPLNVDHMHTAAQSLLGRHDFTSFRAADCQAKTAMREIFSIEVSKSTDEIISFSFRGSAFLKHMVRNMVGSLVEVGRGKHSPEWIAEVLAAKNRTLAGPTAPAHGLCLMEVFYANSDSEIST